jgi:hypothetical protein
MGKGRSSPMTKKKGIRKRKGKRGRPVCDTLVKKNLKEWLMDSYNQYSISAWGASDAYVQ